MRTLIGAIANLAAKTPIPYTATSRAPLSQYGTSYAGAEAQMRAFGSVGTLFAIVNRTSNATAQVEWKLFRKQTDGRRRYVAGEAVDTRIEVTRHAALDLWNMPNPFMPRGEFTETFQQHHDLTGEGWWVIARDERSRIPLEMWPVRPDRIEPVPDRERFLSGYVYRAPSGEKIPLGLDEVIQLRSPNPLDPYRGLGPVQTILADLEGVKASAEWNRNFFLNSAQPGGIIQVPSVLGDEEFNQLRTRWNEQHRGVANAHRVAILEHGEWVDRKYTQQDMQFAQLREVSRETIREAFGFPKPMLGATDDVNRANAEAAEVVFARWLLVPRLERIKQALNLYLLPLFGATGEGVEFDYVSPVPEDREADAASLTASANAAAALIAVGLAASDVLPACGLPEMRYVGQPGAPVSVELPPATEPLQDAFTAARARLVGATTTPQGDQT